MGWIILGWVLTWAGVELHMLQRLLDTESLTGGQWAIVLSLSLITPALVWADKAIQLHRQGTALSGTDAEREAPAGQAAASS
jgi:Ca2+-transporting ATPase